MKRPFVRGPTTLLRTLTITMVINHVSKSWDDPPSGHQEMNAQEKLLLKQLGQRFQLASERTAAAIVWDAPAFKEQMEASVMEDDFNETRWWQLKHLSHEKTLVG